MSKVAEIQKLSHEGRGIAYINGKITFLLGGLAGEKVEFKYLKQHRSFDEGQVTQVLEASPQRVTPPCPHFGVCGGCSLQHLQPEAQIKLKEAFLLEQLQHISGTQPESVAPPLVGPSLGYRSKARLGVKYVAAKNKVLVGFREVNGRYITDMNSCSILDPAVGQRITKLSQLVQSLEAYASIPQIEVAIGDQTTALIFRHLQPLSDADRRQLQQFAAQEQLHIYLQPGGINSVHRLWPESPPNNTPLLYYSLGELKMGFQPTDFTQINPSINQQMIHRALQWLNLQPQDRVLDLFCGLGNFSLPLAQNCREVIGVEGDAMLVARATENAAHNQIDNAQFYCADLTQNFVTQPWAQVPFDKILLDPPRTGAYTVVTHLPILKPRAIVYVSCHSASFARDTAELIKQGYRLTKVCVMDMFPHTSHVESMGLFEP